MYTLSINGELEIEFDSLREAKSVLNRLEDKKYISIMSIYREKTWLETYVNQNYKEIEDDLE